MFRVSLDVYVHTKCVCRLVLRWNMLFRNAERVVDFLKFLFSICEFSPTGCLVVVDDGIRCRKLLIKKAHVRPGLEEGKLPDVSALY